MPDCLDGLVGGDHGELAEAVEPLDFLGVDVEVVGGVEVADLAAEVDLELGAVEAAERPDAALAGAEAVPELGGFAPRAVTTAMPVMTTRLVIR